MFYRPAITFINATLPDQHATTLRVVGERIHAIGEQPHARDLVIDLNGDLLLPGLINAHDHLELNNFPRLKWRERYTNAREWIADFQPRFNTDPTLNAAMAVPIEDRLLIGGLKNLLSGVTTVAHHNPLYPALRPTLFRRDFPVRVVQRYGWAHSLGIDGDVSTSYAKTRKDWPWMIHLAEGIDEDAAAELGQLDAWGCLQTNTLLVHGVGLSDADQRKLIERGSGLIWCPSSNQFLFGRTVDVKRLAVHGRVALGSDSRLSGERDLLEELRVAREVSGLDGRTLFEMVTTHAARLLRLNDAGALRVGALADLIVMPWPIPPSPVWAVSDRRGGQGGEGEYAWVGRRSRRDLRLVMIGGRALIGDMTMTPIFTTLRVAIERVRVDGCDRWMVRAIAARLKLVQELDS